MQTKHIDNQAQLREAKLELKKKMVQTDHDLQDNWLFSFVNKLVGKKKKSNVDETTEDNLKFLASQEQKKFDYEKIGKIVLSIALTIAAPILARKLKGN